MYDFSYLILGASTLLFLDLYLRSSITSTSFHRPWQSKLKFLSLPPSLPSADPQLTSTAHDCCFYRIIGGARSRRLIAILVTYTFGLPSHGTLVLPTIILLLALFLPPSRREPFFFLNF